MPDISLTPRFQETDEAREEGKEIQSLIERYNTSLRMRLNLLREELKEDDVYQLVTIDGTEMFATLMKLEGWDFTTPLLEILIPGVDKPEEKISSLAESRSDYITAELAENKAFRDNWRLSIGEDGHSRDATPFQETNGTAFYADSVHPSAEAHYEIAKFSCKQLQKFNIPCDRANYPIEEAKEDSIYYQKPVHSEL